MFLSQIPTAASLDRSQTPGQEIKRQTHTINRTVDAPAVLTHLRRYEPSVDFETINNRETAD